MSGGLNRSYLTGKRAPNVGDAQLDETMPGPYGILVLDQVGIVTSCNASFAFIADCGTEGLLGNSVCDIFPDLPISERSPEYNRAIVKSRFGAIAWRPHRLVCENGASRIVDVQIQMTTAYGREMFVLAARKTHS